MDKRDRFIAELRREAKGKGLTFKVEKRRGKGSHAIVSVGSKWTSLARDRPEDGKQDQEGLGLD